MTTEHGDDLVEAKAGHARSRVEAVNARIRKAIASHLAAHTGLDARSPELVDLVDVLLLGPLGFKHDAPTVARFRRRLAELAKTVATRAERAVGVPGRHT